MSLVERYVCQWTWGEVYWCEGKRVDKDERKSIDVISDNDGKDFDYTRDDFVNLVEDEVCIPETLGGSLLACIEDNHANSFDVST
jgi:hypothetical protein